MRPRCANRQPDPPAFDGPAARLRHVVLEGSGAPLSFTSFGGQIALRNGSLSCEGCKLQSAGLTYDVNGSARLDRTLDIRLESTGRGGALRHFGPIGPAARRARTVSAIRGEGPLNVLDHVCRSEAFR